MISRSSKTKNQRANYITPAHVLNGQRGHYPLIFTLKVKNDHRSKFSNLSNWKEEA